jgi:four helix bundle protein
MYQSMWGCVWRAKKRIGVSACRRGERRIGVSAYRRIGVRRDVSAYQACGHAGVSAYRPMRDGETIRMRVWSNWNGARRSESVNTFRNIVMSSARHFRELDAYQGAMSLVIRVFELTKRFPSEERYALTDQVRRSSRSVCANLAEAWRKRRYQPAFVSKLSDAEAEPAEIQVHIEIAYRHGYLTQEVFQELDDACDKVLAQIVKMIDHADHWVIKAREARHTAAP